MPLHHQPKSLQRSTMLTIAKHFDKLCYSCGTIQEMSDLINTDEYLLVEGPFNHMPPQLAEDMAEELKHVTYLRRQHLHILLIPSLRSWSSHGVGEILVALPLLIKRCKKLKKLDIGYLRHLNPNVLLNLIPNFQNLVSLNLRMTLTLDQTLAEIGEKCPELVELNLTSTPITDKGLIRLCVSEDGKRVSQKLKRLVVYETSITHIGASVALLSLPNLQQFDYDHIFDALELVEKWDEDVGSSIFSKYGVRHSSSHSDIPKVLNLRTLISTSDSLKIQGVEAATKLCPYADSVTLANAWIENEQLYKFMKFEMITSLSVTNSDGLTLDFQEGILPLLSVCGNHLQNLILANFTLVDVTVIGRSCLNIRNLALSNIAEYSIGQPCNELFNDLQALEIWSHPHADLNPNMFKQLLFFCEDIQNLLFKGCEILNDNLFNEIFKKNKMEKLSHLTIDQCHHLSIQTVLQLLNANNFLTVVRIWSCQKFTKTDNSVLMKKIASDNLDVYLEWFQYDED